MAKPKANVLLRAVNIIDRFPLLMQPFLLSSLMGRVIRFAGTSGLRIEKLKANECIIVLANRKKVQNHIGSVHAAAMALLAESATGFMTALSIPNERMIVLKSMSLEYGKRASGDMKAVAYFSDEQLCYIRDTEKGDIDVPVIITDSNGVETVKVTMVWAWALKRK